MKIVVSTANHDLGWNFPVELDADNIVVPQLMDWPRPSGGGYTLGPDRKFCLFLGRGRRHLEVLHGEVMPKTRAAGIPTAIVDLAKGMFTTDDDTQTRSVRHLPAWLNPCLGQQEFAEDAFKDLEPGWPTHQYRLKPEFAEALARHPLRLWEALIWHGFDWRRNMLNGEQILVQDFCDKDIADITLRSLLKDAERLEQTSATWQSPWWKVGRFRFRLNASQIEIRVFLRPQGRRVVFEPEHYLPKAEQSPDLVEVILTGGPEGKTELLSGWTPCTVFVHPKESPDALAEALAQQIQDWVGAPVEVTTGWGSPKHQEPLNRWQVSYAKASPTKKEFQGFMNVDMPMHRENLMPWRVYDGRILERVEGKAKT